MDCARSRRSCSWSLIRVANENRNIFSLLIESNSERLSMKYFSLTRGISRQSTMLVIIKAIDWHVLKPRQYRRDDTMPAFLVWLELHSLSSDVGYVATPKQAAFRSFDFNSIESDTAVWGWEIYNIHNVFVSITSHANHTYTFKRLHQQTNKREEKSDLIQMLVIGFFFISSSFLTISMFTGSAAYAYCIGHGNLIAAATKPYTARRMRAEVEKKTHNIGRYYCNYITIQEYTHMRIEQIGSCWPEQWRAA